MIGVIRILARQQYAGIDEPEVQRGGGRGALTKAATPPPWPARDPSMSSISDIRRARLMVRRRSVSSASSRKNPLRVVPRRPLDIDSPEQIVWKRDHHLGHAGCIPGIARSPPSPSRGSTPVRWAALPRRQLDRGRRGPAPGCVFRKLPGDRRASIVNFLYRCRLGPVTGPPRSQA